MRQPAQRWWQCLEANNMKKITLIFTFLISVTVSFSQIDVYHPLPDSNAVWVESNYQLQGDLCWKYDDYNMYISGDTIIGIYTYHKLYKNGHVYEHCPPPNNPFPPYDYYGQYWGAFRQDSANKKVYLFDDWNQQDTLAYNFDLNVGDQLPLTFLNESGIVVDSIDSVLVDNHFNKRFWISDYPYWNVYGFIIEGIGNSFGVFAPITAYFECGSSFFCLQVNNETIYNINPSYPCTVINGIEKKIIPNQISISPNPFSIFTTLSVNENLKNAMLTVYNSLGREVKSIKNISGTKIKLQRDNMPIGVYLIRLTQENKVIINCKVIIRD